MRKIRMFSKFIIFLMTYTVISVAYAYANTAPRVASSIPVTKLVEDSDSGSIGLTSIFLDSDQSSATLVYSVISNSTPSLITKTTISGASLSLQLGKNLSGKATLRVRATDSGGLFAEANLPVLVFPVNDKPTTSGLPALTIAGNTRSTAINLSQYFSDLEEASNKLRYSVTAVSNSALISSTTVDPATGNLTINVPPSAAGEVILTIRATDSADAFLERSRDASNFKVYSNFIGDKGVSYPDTSVLGIPEVQLLTNYYFLDYVNGVYQLDHLSESQWRYTLQNEVARDGRPLVVNIENEQYWGNDVAGRDRMAKLMYIAHLERPDIKTLGFYRLLPEKNWFAPVNYIRMKQSISMNLLDYYATAQMQQEATAAYNAWLERNALYRNQAVGAAAGGGTVYQKIDVVYPSLYTIYRNVETHFRYAPVTIDTSTDTVSTSILPYADGSQIQIVYLGSGNSLPTGIIPYKYYTVTNSTFVGNGSKFQLIDPETNSTVNFQSAGTGQQYMFTKGPWENLWEDGSVSEWAIYADENIKESRKYGKSIYPYISPSMEGNGQEYLEKEFFRYQLDTLYDMKTEGVVFYEPGQRGASVYQSQGWWRALSEFMTWLNGPLTTIKITILPNNLAPKAPANLRAFKKDDS